jgi:branched-chain amino acid transport system permease protein
VARGRLTLAEILQPLASGLTLGAMYAMVAVAFVLVYNVTGVINFATGEYLMIGAMTATTLVAAGLPLLAVFVLGTLAAAAVGAVLERVTIFPARRASILTLILITIGLSIALQGAGLLTWGVNPRRFASFSDGPPFQVLGAGISRQSMWVFAFTLVVAVGLWWFLTRTVLGKAMRACEMNPEAARLQGISSSRMSLYAFSLATGLAGAAGVMLVPLTSASYNMGLPLALKGFIAAVIGGLVSPLGAIAGGLLLGVAEATASTFVSSGLKDAIAFGLLFLVIVARPEGLFGRGQGTRV